MELRLTTRRNLYTLFFLGLAVSVFGWGLKYKLSLYDAPHLQLIPAAKLLSKNERLNVAEHTVLSSSGTPSDETHFTGPQPYVLVWVAKDCSNFFCSGNSLREFQGSPRIPDSYRGLTVFSFRPPPALIQL